ncbi:MAG: hypothetical protein JSW52_10890 [Candidatus Coatesbacteria bacterium]|nr:MAG: hypothetical protein JSW52_10890 [Candidatus Coatesbacteria bacterium]
MNGGSPEGLSADELRDVELTLERINEQLAEISRRQEEVAASVGSGIRKAARDVEEFNRKMERDTSRALAGMIAGTKSAANAMRGVWQNFLSFFLNRIIEQISGALGGLVGGGGGGFFGALFGGLLGLFGLQEGGLVRGTREGRLFVLGENFTDELVVPLSKIAAGRSAGGPGQLEVTPQVSIFPRFVIENNAPLDAEMRVYEMAETGRRLVAATDLVGAPENE